MMFNLLRKTFTLHLKTGGKVVISADSLEFTIDQVTKEFTRIYFQGPNKRVVSPPSAVEMIEVNNPLWLRIWTWIVS